VQPHSNGHDEEMFALPLKARDEKVGKLAVKGLKDEDQDSIELVNAVAERLSAHIENLRLFEETRLGQIELDKRAQQLAAVAEISTVSSREFDIQKMLESVVHLTQRKFNLYHCHVFLYNEQANTLKIAACGWKAGDEHEGTHGTATIPLDQEQSLVARAARTRKAVIVNDVLNEPGWLPNPLLPDTASELAVPLLIGDRILGVLDVQSDHINAFTGEDANIQTTLASQVATALQNAYSFNQAQSALAQSEQLFDASRNLTQATDLQQLVSTAVNTLKIPAINRAILVAFNYGTSDTVESLDVIANWWNGTGLQVTAVGTHYPLEVVRVMPMFVSPTPVFFNDSFSDERVDETTMQLVKRLNLRAVAVLPLHTGSGQIGALILEAEVPHNFTTEETRLFIAIAPQIATIMDNRRQFERAQKQAEREAMLNVINQKIQSATSVEAVLQIAARELGHALGAPMTIAQLSMKDRSS
jgi:GAF domain-containing protein